MGSFGGEGVMGGDLINEYTSRKRKSPLKQKRENIKIELNNSSIQ